MYKRQRLIAEAEHADGLRRAEIETRLVDIGAHSAPARAAAILHGLGFDAAAQARPCSDFSGGWRMRVALAAVLFSEPDLLLLDEPTNYLDIEGTLWLYDYLERYPRTAIIISHDRDLLDTSVDHILHLDRGKLTIYRGGYTSFAKQLSEKRVLQAKAKAKQDAERAHLQSFIDRFKAKATKARQAQSRMKRLAKMEPIAALLEDDVPVIHLPSPEKPLSPPIVAMERVKAGYGDRIVLTGLDLSLAPDDRVALLGANGNGKSTFCKLIGGRLGPVAGEVKRSSKMEVAYFAQHQLDELRMEDTPVAHLRDLMPDAPEAKVRSKAAQIGFPAAKAETRATAAWALDVILKLLHPVMPFLTEELWRQTADLGAARAEPMLISARWPDLAESLIDPKAQAEIATLVAAIGGGRAVRSELGVPGGARLPALEVVDASAEVRRIFEANSAIIETMLRVDAISFVTAPSAGAVPFIEGADTYALPVAEHIDIAAEKVRLAKEVAARASDIAHVMKKLGNPDFLARAKEEVIEENRERLEEAEAAKAKLEAALTRLEGMN